MKLIVLIAGALSMGLGACAVVVGDPLVGSLLFIAPLVWWGATMVWSKRKKRNQEFAGRLADAQEFERMFKEKRKAEAEAEYNQALLRDKHTAIYREEMQRQQMQMLAAQQAAREQRAAMAQQRPSGMSYGFSDPRASFSSQAQQRSSDSGLSDLVNAAAIYSMLNQPSTVHATTASPSGPAITDTLPSRVDPIQFHSFVNSGPSEPSSSSSSSSSYSSDTSSDSFGGSDTSSDSF